MLFAYCHDSFPIPLPAGHRFPAGKYERLRRDLQDRQVLQPGQFVTAAPATTRQLQSVHTEEYIQKVLGGSLSEKEVRRIGLPWSPMLVERSLRSAGSTIQACLAALSERIAINLGGGTHHAYPDHGEGYCVFNDAAIAARTLQSEGRIERVLIIDCDVHQGNGTAAIFKDDPTVYTFSIHGQKNFPFHKEPSDLDIGLPDHAGDDEYLHALQAGLDTAIGRAQAGMAIYLAGADPFMGDTLGRLSLTKAGLAGRDRMVLTACRNAGLPVAVAMAGGYAKDIQDTVDIHVQTVEIARVYQETYR